MILDLQSILSDRQVLSGTGNANRSDNAIDLGDYSSADSDGTRDLGRIAGYPAKVGTTAPANRNQAFPEGYIGRYRYAHRLGASNLPFFGVINADITRATTDPTSMVVDFRVAGNQKNAMTGKDEPAGTGTVVASVTMTDLTKGSQIPWPSIPRYLTNRWFFLVYTLNGAGAITGTISAGFTPHIASEL